jgi:hypothetical protein
MTTLSDRLRVAMVCLHRAKTRDYGTAWKKRGEVLSVLANIARKVDRVGTVAGRDVATHDESILDTYIDLLIYSLKYETLLADASADTARELRLRPSPDGGHSDGVNGFEQLLAALDLSPLDATSEPAGVAPQDIAAAFTAIERCFSGLTPSTPVIARLLATKNLAEITVRAIADIAKAKPQLIEDFIAHQGANEE